MSDIGPTDSRSRVFSIPSGVPFLPTFVSALLAGTLVPGFAAEAGPLGLADATIFVPTRRSARALAACFTQHLGAAATFLPRILPLADADALETEALLDPAQRAAFEMEPVVGATTRRLVLTRLITAWGRSVRAGVASGTGDAVPLSAAFEVASTAADAWHLSGELAGLLDEFIQHDIDAKALAPLGTEAFDRYWSLTLDFLRIATERWPAILASRGEADTAVRRKSLLDREIARLAARPAGSGPMVVAGAFGSDPPTLALLAAIARLPQGAVVLPGLDQDLDDASWALLGTPAEAAAGHPQSAFCHVLTAAGLGRSDVIPLGTRPPHVASRAALVGEAFRPAETTEAWSRLATADVPLDRVAALEAVALIEAAHEGEEALALAVALREALEGDGATVLVTPDRGLARRVREELLRWGIEVDDSGGEPLSATPAGALAQLALACVTGDLDPVAVLSLLAHPGCRLGRPRSVIDALRRRTERRLLRGVVPKGALADPASFIAAVREREDRAMREQAADRPAKDALWTEIERLMTDLLRALEPLATPGVADLSVWLVSHEAVVAALTETEDGSSALGGVDGTRLAGLFAEFRRDAEPGLPLDRQAYAALFGRIASEAIARGPARSHPRLKILGLLEFRLLDADRVCLGGLDEGIWPPPVKTDAFLNRPMRQALGLPPPERRIGQFAHDFAMALGAPEVIISRAAKRGGAPTVPSRFLQRLAAVAGDQAWQACRSRGAVYLDLARALDRPRRAVTIRRPAPKPPVHLRPTQLSVTRIETLRRDPYAIYAEKILGLRPLDPVGASHGPREWGTAFHDVLRDFVEEVRHGPVSPESLAGLLAKAQAAFAPLMAEPHTQAFMAPRLTRWVRAFHEWDRTRRGALAGLDAELKGRLDITLDDGSVFELTATADRIERSPAGGIRLVDYKTGVAPSKKEVAAGFAPQLTLEAAIALGGGFAALEAIAAVDEAMYVQFGTGREVATVPLAWTDRTLDEVVAEHLAGLRDLLNGFRDPAVGYVARPYPQFLARFGDYDHLSRIKEWSATGGLGDPAGDAA